MLISILDRSAGFYSIFHFTLNHLIYCKKNNISFQLDTTQWLFKYKDGWTDYFQPFEIKNGEEGQRPNKSVKYIKHYQTAGNFPLYEYTNVIKEIYVYNDAVVSEIEKTKLKLNLQQGTYDAIFIRRGDKLISESIYIPTDKYADLLLEKNPDCQTIFLQTDDYRAFIELEDYIKTRGLNIKAITLCDPSINGMVIFEHAHRKKLQTTTKMVTELNPEEMYKHTLDMLIGVDILLNSNICVCDYQSNVSRFVKLAHNHPNNVYDVMNPTEDIDMNRVECPSFGNFRGEQKLDCLVRLE
jgi:hypothetical protein